MAKNRESGRKSVVPVFERHLRHVFYLFHLLEALRWRLVIVAHNHILLIVGEKQCGERQRDDHADESEERAPYREAEQDDGLSLIHI